VAIALCVSLANCGKPADDDGALFFSLSELRNSSKEIYETVSYWEKSQLRKPLPISRKELVSGFILEHGNSNFKDYHLLVGAENSNRAVRVFLGNKEITLTDEDKHRFGVIFEKAYKDSSKNINPYVRDGDMYLVTLVTENGILKIPYYSPDVDAETKVDQILLLKELLHMEQAFSSRLSAR
jgi:hypothetical protein